MRSSNLKHIDITAQIEAFFTNGGKIAQCPEGNCIRENDGLTPRQMDKQSYAARQEREAVK